MTRRGALGSGRSAAGFTLVELLVALTLLGLLAVLMHGGLRFGGRVWETGSERAAEVAQVQSAQSFLRRQLHRATRGSDDGEAALAGTAEELRFIAPLPAYVAPWARYGHTVRVAGDSGRRDLVVSWRRLQDGDSETQGDQNGNTILVSDVKRVEFGYFGRAGDRDEAPRWHEDWTDGDEVPRLVRIRIGFGDDDPRYWPDLVVSPKLVDTR